MTEKEVRCNKTFIQIYKEWLPTHEEKVGKSTMDCYKSAVKYFEPVYHYKFIDVTPAQLQECIDNCPHGKRTKQNMKALVSLLYNYGKFTEIIDVNKSEALSFGKDETRKYDALSIENLNEIKQCDLPYASYIVALCYLGCRPNELFRTKRPITMQNISA